MPSNTNFDQPLSLLTNHPHVVDAFTKQYYEYGYVSEEIAVDPQDTLRDALAVRERHLVYLQKCLENGHQESVWGALIEITNNNPIAGFYITLKIRNSTAREDVKNDLTEFIYYLISHYSELQVEAVKDECIIALYEQDFKNIESSAVQEDDTQASNGTYSEIGDKAVALADSTFEEDRSNYVQITLLLDKIDDPTTKAHYESIIGHIYGKRALAYAKEGEDILAYAITSIIPTDEIRREYQEQLKEHIKNTED